MKSDSRDSGAPSSKKLLKCTVDVATRSEKAYYVAYKRCYKLRGGENAIQNCPYLRRYVERIVYSVWFVPDSPILWKRFQCHLNVDLGILTAGRIKSLSKYACKARDRETAELRSNNLRSEKVFSLQDTRYISASEAVWRLLRKGYVEHHPIVVQLDVHLLSRLTVCF